MNVRFLIIYFGCMVPWLCAAQIDFDGTALQDSLNEDWNVDVPDSTVLNYFYSHRLGDLHPFEDTTLGVYSQHYDPIRKRIPVVANLGNPGSAHIPLLLDVSRPMGLDLGYRGYSQHRLDQDRFRFFDLNRPFASLSFTPGSSQQNFVVSTLFSRDFANGWNFSVDYRRISQQGFYTNQATKATQVGLGLWFHNPNDKHDTFITFISNSNNEENNGGVSDRTLFEQPFYDIRLRIPVTLTNAGTRLTNRRLSLQNYWHLSGAGDADVWKMSLRHEFAYSDGSFKSYDDGLSAVSDSTFYDDFLIDSRGIRHFTAFDQIENGVYMHIRAPSDFRLSAGLVYNRYGIDQPPFSEKRHALFLVGDADISIRQLSNIRADAKIGFGDYAGDFRVRGQIQVDLGVAGRLSGAIGLQRQRPSVLEERLVLSEVEVWNNTFSKPLTTWIHGAYAHRSIGFEASFRQTLINDPIYYDASTRPEQWDGNVSITQLRLSEQLHWKIWHFDNHVMLQSISESIYGQPNFSSQHALYIKALVFKQKMLLKTGFDVRIVEAYTPPAFHPLLNQFYPQVERSEEWTYITDFYINFKIDRFQTFFKFENITDMFTDRIFYLVDGYPQFDWKFRLGVTWQLKD